MKSSILIVDDDRGLAELVAHALIVEGFEAAVAVDGRDGVAHLADKAVDLAIVDLEMPAMNGAELVRRMRADPALANIAVVAVTAAPHDIDQRADYDAVLRKPFTSADLLRTVAEVLESAAARAAPHV